MEGIIARAAFLAMELLRILFIILGVMVVFFTFALSATQKG